MTKTKEIRGKLLKYAGDKLQDSQVKSERIMKYVYDISNVSKELIYSSILMANHKYIEVEQEGQS